MRYIIVNLILLIILIPCFINKKIDIVQIILIFVCINILLTTGIDMFAKYFTFENMTRPSFRPY